MHTQAKLIEMLTDEKWDRRRRNSVARQIALGRSAGVEPLIRTTYIVSQSGVVSRYDRLRAKLMEILAETGGCAAHVRSHAYNYQGKRLRYDVVLFGYQSDVQRAIDLYEGLIQVILGQIMEISGEDVAVRRRQWFNLMLDRVHTRLTEVDSAPSMAWVLDHQYVASEALENSPARWHAEIT